MDRPGWREARKLAGRPYALVTGPVEYSESPQAIEQAALLGRENTLRLIDGFMAELRDLRSAIADQDKAALQSLLERLRRAPAMVAKTPAGQLGCRGRPAARAKRLRPGGIWPLHRAGEGKKSDK